jgi:hypothetical protein
MSASKASAADEVARAVAEAANQELDEALSRIEHCLRQLSDQQIWSRAQPELNSVGNLLLHLSGNMRQWLVAGLRGSEDQRNRPAEFSEQGPLPRERVLGGLRETVREAQAAMRTLTAVELLRVRRIQGFEITPLTAIFGSVPHFRGHTQEIIRMSREMLGDNYKFAWQPESKEQGAP